MKRLTESEKARMEALRRKKKMLEDNRESALENLRVILNDYDSVMKELNEMFFGEK